IKSTPGSMKITGCGVPIVVVPALGITAATPEVTDIVTHTAELPALKTRICGGMPLEIFAFAEPVSRIGVCWLATPTVMMNELPAGENGEMLDMGASVIHLRGVVGHGRLSNRSWGVSWTWTLAPCCADPASRRSRHAALWAHRRDSWCDCRSCPDATMSSERPRSAASDRTRNW